MTGTLALCYQPDLVNWNFLSGDGVNATYQVDGKPVVNGRDGVDSRELVGL